MMVTSASVRLLCLPYAGASSTLYARWRRRLPAWIEVLPLELPGRAQRMAEPLQTSMPGLIRALITQLPAPDGRPFALFGHSLGALVAFELALYLQARELDLPLVLFASGAHAPSRRNAERFAALQSDAELRAELARLNGTPASVLADAELMALTLPILRADFAVAASYVGEARSKIDCPIHALGGSSDETTELTLGAWREHTRREFFSNVLPGGHFFIHEQETQLLCLLRLRLQALLADPRRSVSPWPAAGPPGQPEWRRV
jgi:surfactin synthase thioesterase subunit